MRARPEAAARPNTRNSKSSTQSSQSQGRQARDLLAIAALHRIASAIGRNADCRHAQSATDLIDVFNLLHFFVFFVSFCSKMSPLPYTRYSPKLIGSTVGQERSQQMTAGTSPLSFVTCASNDATLRTNLLASPCFAPDWRTRSSQSGTARAPRMGSISALHGRRRIGSSAFIKMCGCRRDGTDASQSNSMKQSDGSGRSGSRGFTVSAR